jgi:hypothetical protein
MNAIQTIDGVVRDRVANLLLHEVPVEQISRVTGLTVEQITDIQNDDSFRQILTEKTIAQLDEQKIFNDGWDGVEARALSIVAAKLTTTNDADYALKAAVLANKAQRRGHNGNRVIDSNAPSRAVIVLNQTFIDKLQHLTMAAPPKRDTTSKKQQDYMAPGQVEKLLLDETAQIFADKNLVEVARDKIAVEKDE